LASAAAEWAVRPAIPTDSAVVTEVFEDTGESPAISNVTLQERPA